MNKIKKRLSKNITKNLFSVAGRRELSNRIYQTQERYCELPEDGFEDFLTGEDTDFVDF